MRLQVKRWHEDESAEIEPCTVLVYSGVPPLEPVFNASLCDSKKGRRHQKNFGIEFTHATVPYYDAQHGRVYMATNTGTVGCYGAREKKMLWKSRTGPVWEDSHDRVSNSVQPLGEGVILVSGRNELVAIEVGSGRVVGGLTLPQELAAFPIVGDWDGDGVDDVIFITSDATWGYRVEVTKGRMGPLSILILICAALFVAFKVLRSFGAFEDEFYEDRSARSAQKRRAV